LFVQYCINDPNTSERSDKIVDMSKLDATVDKITLQMQRFTTLQTSVEKSDYKDRYTASEYFLRAFLRGRLREL
jgi:hypothetical protein